MSKQMLGCGVLWAVLIGVLIPARAMAAAPLLDLRNVPAPVYDDPVWHGAADPTLIWNEARHEWMMYYTQRRATLLPTHGVDWTHGTAIGIASSNDGLHWEYEGICQGDQSLSTPVESKCTWWAPSVYFQGGTYHMFVVYVDGIYTDWSGKAYIKHFTSDDGLTWTFKDTLKLSSNRCIDACVDKIGDQYRIWYKDEHVGGHTWMASSDDLVHWKVDGEMAGDVGQEAPLVWRWKGKYWLIVDAGNNLRVYQSEDGLKNWKYNATVLADHGTREKDNSNGKHPFVLAQGDRAFIYYFVHYKPTDPTYGARRTVIQLAELELNEKGEVVCDRNRSEGGQKK